jgi:hypothetical protein
VVCFGEKIVTGELMGCVMDLSVVCEVEKETRCEVKSSSTINFSIDVTLM